MELNDEMMVRLRKQQWVFNRCQEATDAAVNASNLIASQIVLASTSCSDEWFACRLLLELCVLRSDMLLPMLA